MTAKELADKLEVSVRTINRDIEKLSEAMRNLRHDGMLKVIAGLTSLTEVARVTNE